MAFFGSAVTTLVTVVTALGSGLAVWGIINLLEGYGGDNPGSKSQGMKQVMANKLEQPKERKSTVWTLVRWMMNPVAALWNSDVATGFYVAIVERLPLLFMHPPFGSPVFQEL